MKALLRFWLTHGGHYFRPTAGLFNITIPP